MNIKSSVQIKSFSGSLKNAALEGRGDLPLLRKRDKKNKKNQLTTTRFFNIQNLMSVCKKT